MYGNATSDNSGGNVTNFAGNTGANGIRRLLIRFDLSTIPTNATVQTATLQMSIVKSAPTAPVVSHSIHKVTNSWVEGTGTGTGGGGMIVIGAASWAYRETATLAWTNPGCDFVGTESAVTSVGTGVQTVAWSGAGVVTDVQGWIANPSTNFGWVIRGQEGTAQSARVYASAEEPTASLQPVLTVNYTVPSSVDEWSMY